MALDLNKSDKEVVASFSLYTGLCDMKTVSINPTMEEIKALELPVQKEPVYTTEATLKDDNDQPVGEPFTRTRVDIFLNCVTPLIKAKLAFFIDDRVRLNQKGTKVQWINLYGATCWTDITLDENGVLVDAVKPNTLDSYKNWFKMDGARYAKPGEEQLTEWLKAWGNVGNGGKCQIESIDAIAKGNLSELRQYLVPLKDQQVRYMLGVRQGQYQAVYDKMFGRTYEKSNARWIKQLQDQYGKFDAEYQGLVLQRYQGNLEGPNTPGTQTGSTGNPGLPNSGGLAGAGGKMVF